MTIHPRAVAVMGAIVGALAFNHTPFASITLLIVSYFLWAETRKDW